MSESQTSNPSDGASTDPIEPNSSGSESDDQATEQESADRELATDATIPEPLSTQAARYNVYPALLPVEDRAADPVAIGNQINQTVSELDSTKRSFTLGDCNISEGAVEPEVVDAILRLHQFPVCMFDHVRGGCETSLYAENSCKIDPERVFDCRFWNPKYNRYPAVVDPIKDTENRLAFLRRYGMYGTGKCRFFANHFDIEPQSVTDFIDTHTDSSSTRAYLRADREKLTRTIYALEQQTEYEQQEIAPALNANPSTLRDWKSQYLNDDKFTVPSEWKPTVGWADATPEPIFEAVDHDRRKISISGWAEYHRVEAEMLPLYSRLYDPLTTALQIAEILPDLPAGQQNFTLSSVDLDIYNDSITNTLLRLHGVLEYERGGRRPKRYWNPNYQHYDTVLKPITDTDRRLRIYDKHTELGAQTVSWFCDHFGLTEAELVEWATAHDRMPPRQAVQKGRAKLGRTLHTVLQWSPWSVEALAEALNQPEETLRQWILDGVDSNHPERGEWQVPRRPVKEGWFSATAAYHRYDRDPVRFWQADTLRDRTCKKE